MKDLRLARTLRPVQLIFWSKPYQEMSLRSMTYQKKCWHSKHTSQAKDMKVDEKSKFFRYIIFSETVGTMQGYRTFRLSIVGRNLVSWRSVLNMRRTVFLPSLLLVSRWNAYIVMKLQQSTLRKVLCAIERIVFAQKTERAEEGAIQLFSETICAISSWLLHWKGAWFLGLTQLLVQVPS